MHEELNQKISQLLDDELSQKDALGLLRRLQLDPKLQDKFSRYEAISHAIKTEEFFMAQPDFAGRISQQLEHEPAHSPAQRASFQYGYRMLTLAASVAAVAVFASWDMIHQAEPTQLYKPETVSLAAQAQPKTAADPQLAAKGPSNEIPLNQRINDYLQAHNNSVYTNGEANFQPYTRVTAYARE